MKAFGRIFLVSALLIGSSHHARASGIGAWFEYGNVFDGSLTTDYRDFDYEEDHFGFGLSIDTNVAMDQLFNYRLDVGYQRVEAEYEGDDGWGDESFDADGLVLDNAFGFGLIRNDRVRLWVGPAVRMSLDFFEDDSYDFAIGVGPEVGLNIHANDRVSLGITLGYQAMYSLTVYDSSHGDDWDHDDWDEDWDDDWEDDEDGYEQALIFKVLVLFRTPDDVF